MKNKKAVVAVLGALVALLGAVYSYVKDLPEAPAVQGAAGAPAVVVAPDAGL